MTRLILLTVTFSVLFLNVQGQSNEYFKHGEGWSQVAYGAEGNVFYSYVFQVGDTIINNDTLVKLKNPYSVYDTTFFLAKSHLGILTMYYSNNSFSSFGDSVIVDYSRLDSITQWNYNNMGAFYTAKAINSIDTIYFGPVAKKIFNISDDCFFSGYEDYAYEGVLGFFDSCFEYSNWLLCYTIFDSAYQVNSNTFTYMSSGICSINLGIDEINNENKKIVKIVDMMGREVIDNPNNIFIYIYDDGSTEKVFRIE